jgi:hypothetical protein
MATRRRMTRMNMSFLESSAVFVVVLLLTADVWHQPVSAFSVVPRSTVRPTSSRRSGSPATATAIPSKKLSDIDEMCVENVAELCLETDDDCDVEEYTALINQLQDQKEFHLGDDKMVERLDHLVHDLKAHDHKLSAIDEMCIENVALGCLGGGNSEGDDTSAAAVLDCDLEELEALVNQLQDQKLWHKDRADVIDHLVHDLQEQQQQQQKPQ